MRMSPLKVLRRTPQATLAVLFLALLLVNPVLGQSISPTYSSTVTTEYPLPIPFAPTVATTFTSYFSSDPYATGTFTVSASGTYTATFSSNPARDMGLWLLTGVFSPSASSTPTTPLANFFAATQTNTTATIPNVTLTAGTQYSYLLVANGGSGTFTLSLSGPGTATFGGSAPTPTPINSRGTLAIMIAALGFLMLVKKRALAA